MKSCATWLRRWLIFLLLRQSIWRNMMLLSKMIRISMILVLLLAALIAGSISGQVWEKPYNCRWLYPPRVYQLTWGVTVSLVCGPAPDMMFVQYLDPYNFSMAYPYEPYIEIKFKVRRDK